MQQRGAPEGCGVGEQGLVDERPQPMNGLKLGSNEVRFAFWKDTSGGIVGDWLWEHWLK